MKSIKNLVIAGAAIAALSFGLLAACGGDITKQDYADYLNKTGGKGTDFTTSYLDALGEKLCVEIDKAGGIPAYVRVRDQQGPATSWWDISADYGTRFICTEWRKEYAANLPVADVG